MMSQSLATYPLLQCVVSTAQFTSGEVSFYDAYAELTAMDAEGSCTAPLRIDYDVLEHFRIVRAQCVMRLTLPDTEVRQWAEKNGFASQLDVCNDDLDDCDNNALPAASNARVKQKEKNTSVPYFKSAVLLLQLNSEDMACFLQTIAPLVAASRRTRSASRISVTEPLPLYESVADPAPDMQSETCAKSDRCGSTAYTTRLSEQWLEETTEAVYRSNDRTEEKQNGTQTPSLKRCTVPLDDAANLISSPSTTKQAADRITSNPALLGDKSPRFESANPSPQTKLLHTPRQTSKTPQTHVILEAIESVEEQLAGLLDDTDFPHKWSATGGEQEHYCGQPLLRPCLVFPAALVGAEATRGHGGRGRGRGGLPLMLKHKGACFSKAAATPSLCPSLPSSVSEKQAYLSSRATNGHATQPVKVGEMTTERGKSEGKINRLVITHLCASDRASAISAEAPAAQKEETAVEENGGETVATVTFQRDRFDERERGSRANNPFQTESEPQKTEQPTAMMGQERPLVSDVVSVAENLNPNGSAPRTQQQSAALAAPFDYTKAVPSRRARKTRLGRSLSPSSFSTRLGDLLQKDVTREVAENSSKGIPKLSAQLPSAQTESIKDADRPCIAVTTTPTANEPRLTVHFHDNATHFPSHSSTKAQPLNAAERRDLKSYLLDLFPQKEPSTQRRLTKKTGRPPVIATAAAREAPRWRGRPPKPKETDATPMPIASANTKHPHDAAADKSASKDKPIKSGNNAGQKEVEVPQHGVATISMHATKRKRCRSESGHVDERAVKHSPPYQGAIAVTETEAQREQKSKTSALTNNRKSNADSTAKQHSLRTRKAEALDIVGSSSPTGLPSRSAADVAEERTRKPAAGALTDTSFEHTQRYGKEENRINGGTAAEGEEENGAAATTGSPECDAAHAAVETLLTTTRRRATALTNASATALAAVPLHSTPDGAEEHKQITLAVAAAREAARAGGEEVGSNSTSEATCPLFYRRDSRKERTRRLLRYMNLVSQSLASLHETHDELRGLLLTMIDANQL